jgi:hypothetical protein
VHKVTLVPDPCSAFSLPCSLHSVGVGSMAVIFTCELLGKRFFLGPFSDPVSAAKRYDREAARAFGPRAHLNFPAEGNTSPSAGKESQPPVLSACEVSAQEQRPTPASLPAGPGEGTRALSPSSEIYLSAWLVHGLLCEAYCVIHIEVDLCLIDKGPCNEP